MFKITSVSEAPPQTPLWSLRPAPHGVKPNSTYDCHMSYIKVALSIGLCILLLAY